MVTLPVNLQWYSEMLARHADQVMTVATSIFDGLPLQLAVRIPGNHWWYNTASHAPEMTAGCVGAVAALEIIVFVRVAASI